MKKSGIYKITNSANGKFYIGSAVCLTRRFNEHKRQLKKGIHPNRFLQNAWNKYGANAFDFSVLELVADVNNLLEREQIWIDETKCFEKSIGYNLSPTANSILGYKFSDEQKARVSNGIKGKEKSASHRANLWKNREKSDDFLALMSANGKKRKGKKLSAEHCRNKAMAQTGEKNHRAKLTNSQILEIKIRLKNGELGKNLAIEFEVTDGHISEIKNNKKRASVTL